MGIGKVILGIVLLIVGLWLILPTSWCQSLSSDFRCLGWWQELVDVAQGLLPALLIFIGALLVWIETEEMRLERPKRKR